MVLAGGLLAAAIAGTASDGDEATAMIAALIALIPVLLTLVRPVGAFWASSRPLRSPRCSTAAVLRRLALAARQLLPHTWWCSRSWRCGRGPARPRGCGP